MRLLGNRTDHELDVLFRGETPAGAEELAARLHDAKRTLVRGPRPEVASAHLAAMADSARLLISDRESLPLHWDAETRSRSDVRRGALRRMRRIAASLVVATVAGMSSMVGLAYAGVGLPPPAVAAFDKIGISLPNQAGSADSGQPGSLPSASQHGQDVKAIATAGPGGCAFGQAVAATASSKRQDAKAASHRKDAGHRPADVCDQAKGAGGTTSAGGPSIGQGHSPGYGKDNHPSGSSATGEQTNPTGNGTSTNPTGNGKDNHPSDQASGTSTNPTGNGTSTNPTDHARATAARP